jgi:hypothetical protein
MIREEIIRELTKRGYDVAPYDTTKNGIELKGIMFNMPDGMNPIIYVDEQTDTDVEKSVEEIIELLNNSNPPKLDINKFKDRDYFLGHLYVGLQKVTNEDLVKCPIKLNDMEAYLYVRDETENNLYYRIKCKHGALEILGISESEAWERAYENTFKETEIKSMNEFVGGCEDMCDIKMYVLTNAVHYLGASAILNVEALKEVGKLLNTDKVFALPLSIHEFIIVPFTDDIDKKGLSEMVREINENEVAPLEQLSDTVYTINLKEMND